MEPTRAGKFPFKPITERAPEMTKGQRRCYDLLATWAGGTHHLYGKVDQCERGLSYTLSGSLDTYDWNRLTTLVMLAHARCVRVEVAAAARGYLRLYLHPRVREGRIHEKHPTMSEALAAFPYCDLTSAELAAESAQPSGGPK